MEKFVFIDNFPLDMRAGVNQTSLTFHVSTNEFLTMHCHDYWEFIVVTQGSLYNMINGRQVLLEKNTMAIIRPDDRHYLKAYGARKFRYINVAVRNELMLQQLNVLDGSLYESMLHMPEIMCGINDGAIFELENRIHLFHLLLIGEPKLQEHSKKMIFLHLISIFSSELYTQKRQYPGWLANIMSILEEPSNIHLNINEICDLAAYSRTHLNRLFKQHFNQTPKEYLLKLKLNYACRLLQSSDMTVLNISTSVGYSSLAQFNLIFKKVYNLTPGAYRKKYRFGI